jgi:hypothetical protein
MVLEKGDGCAYMAAGQAMIWQNKIGMRLNECSLPSYKSHSLEVFGRCIAQRQYPSNGQMNLHPPR